MNETLLDELAAADPAVEGVEDEERVADIVRRMSVAARQTAIKEAPSRGPWWRRRRAMIPLGIAGVVALTGAAVAFPLTIGVNGKTATLDVVIPITYTTDTGMEVSCSYGIYFGDPATRNDADERLAVFAQEHDWSGIGQRIYDEAIANPFVPGPDDDWEDDSPEIRDSFSFHRATELIWSEIPAELRPEYHFAARAMDCTGQLH